MRLANAQDLGLYVRDCRRDAGLTQVQLSKAAGVSRRWLSDLEAGKSTAEVGLVFKVLSALGLILDASPRTSDPGAIDLDAVLDRFRRPASGPDR